MTKFLFLAQLTDAKARKAHRPFQNLTLSEDGIDANHEASFFTCLRLVAAPVFIPQVITYVGWLQTYSTESVTRSTAHITLDKRKQ